MLNILIVEDEVRIASFIAKGLQRQGVVTTIAADGMEALSLIHQEKFDGLLLDIGLPILDGWNVISRLRREHNPIPIVVMTALSDERNSAKALALGAQALIQKPFRFEELSQVLKACLQLENS